MTTNDCGIKHITLAGIIVGVVCLIVAGAFGYSIRSTGVLDERVRILEINYAQISNSIASLERSSNGIEDRLRGVETKQAVVIKTLETISDRQVHMIELLDKKIFVPEPKP